MKIKILGTRGEIPETCRLHAKQSGVLVDDVLLLDLGEKSFLDLHPKWILITHFHPDHAYFVRKHKEEIPETEALIFAPEKPPYEKAASKVRILNKKRKIGPYTVVPIPTHHSKNVKSQGYFIKKGKFSFLYTGDLVWMDKEYHSLFQNTDLIIMEASFFRKGGMVQRDKVTGNYLVTMAYQTYSIFSKMRQKKLFSSILVLGFTKISKKREKKSRHLA